MDKKKALTGDASGQGFGRTHMKCNYIIARTPAVHKEFLPIPKQKMIRGCIFREGMLMPRENDRLRLGDSVQFVPDFRRPFEITAKSVTGRIIWLHPRMRYAVVEYSLRTFTGEDVTMRETLIIHPDARRCARGRAE